VIKSRLEGLAREIKQAQNRRTRKIWAIIFDRALRVLGPHFANQNVIYRLDRTGLEAGSVVGPQGFQVRCSSATDDLPTSFWLALEAAQPNTSREKFISPFAERGLLWIGIFGEAPVCYAWSTRGRDLKEWYVPLQPDDIVIFAVVTWPGYRGIGLARNIVQHIARVEGNDGVGVYLDTKEWNLSAQRSFERAGFRRVAVKAALESKHP
jgi:ribosomal protein S18 acetylase RimI-like enzyme